MLNFLKPSKKSCQSANPLKREPERNRDRDPKRERSLLICLLFLIPFPSFAIEPAIKQTEPISLGAIVSLTGPAARQGESWLAGAEFAVEELKKEGITVKLEVQDDQTNPRQAAQAFQHLRSAKKVKGIIGGTWDYLAETLYPLATRYTLPFVTPTNPPELVSKEALKSPYVIIGGLTLVAEQKAIEGFLKSRRVKTVAMLYPDLPWGASHAKMMREAVKNTGGKIILDQSFPYEGYLDAVKVASAKIVKANPDLVYLPIDAQGLDLSLREYELRKFKPLVLTSQHLHSAIALASDSERYSKAYGVYPALRSESFENQFEDTMGKHWWPYAGAGYDAVHVLVELQKTAFYKSRALKPFKYEGVTGTYSIPAERNAAGTVTNNSKIVQFKDHMMRVVD